MSFPPKPPTCPVCYGENETFIGPGAFGLPCSWCDDDGNIDDPKLWDEALKAELDRRAVAQPEVERRAGRLK